MKETAGLRLMWFAGLWVMGVVAVGGVAYAIRLLMKVF